MRILFRAMVLGLAVLGAKTLYERWAPQLRRFSEQREHLTEDVRTGARGVSEDVGNAAGEVRRDVMDATRRVKQEVANARAS